MFHLNQDKFGIYSVVNLAVFDEDGELVTVLDTLESSYIDLNEGTHGVVFAKDALLNKNFLEFVSKRESNKVSDYEKLLTSKKEKQTFVFNSNPTDKKCKLLARTWYRNAKEGKDYEVMYEIPNAKLTNKYKFEHENGRVGMFDYVFKILPFNSENDTFKIHMDELQ